MIAIVYGHTANEFPEILAGCHLEFTLGAACFATGIFLFLSGYGLTLSIKRNNIDSSYVRRHIQKLLLPYIVFWLFYLLMGCLYGSFPTDDNLFADFVSLRMPNTDTWFFRTILALYVLYFGLARYLKSYAGILMSFVIVLYVAILVYYEVSPSWWNTIMCFPIGILYASRPNMCRRIPFVWLVVLGVLFVTLYKYSPIALIGAISTPIILSLMCAYLSTIVVIPPKVPVLTFIGINSLYMYFMETIPIEYLVSGEVGFVIFVVGGIGITIVLTYIGKYVETYIKIHII